ncbi:MAG: peptidoglycan DD-metalloendopeptidase family protein [Clostridia bacterium]|nr:peptidoglycan DD-metalloendopeptidase family protein [Clostridia bacterium]
MKFNPFRSKKIKFTQKPAKIKQAGEKSPAERNESAERVNRTVYLTVAVLLIVLAAAVAMTSAANKARRGQPAETSAPETTLRSPETAAPAPETTAPPAETAAPEDTAASGEQTDLPVAAGIPTLSLPAEGTLGKEHDPTVQVFSNTLGEWRVHLGIDIMTEAAAPVYAAAKGKVKQIADDPLWGKCIWIEHDGDAVSVYRGLDDTLAEGIKIGAKVSEGTLLGAVGEGGVLELAEEPHLHFEMKVAGEDADPLEYFSKSALEILARKPENVYED